MGRTLFPWLVALMTVSAGTAAADPVMIAGVPDGTLELSVRGDAKELRRSFRLIAQGVPAVKVQAVRLSACSGADGQACQDAAVSGTCASGCELSASQPGDVTVVIPTPAAGVYTASLEIVYVQGEKPAGDGKVMVIAAVHATPLEVTKPAVPLTAVDVLVGPRGDEVERLPFEHATATFRFRLHDKDGAPYDVDQLIIGPVVRKRGTDDVQTAAAARAVYVTADGKRTEVASGGKIPAAAVALHVEIRGLDRAGTFAGTLRLLAANRTPQEVSYTVTARDGVWIAVLWIVVGVMISYVVQWWSGQRRGRLVQQRSVARLRERVVELSQASERDRRVRAALLAECDARLDELDDGDAIPAADLARLVRRVELAVALSETGQAVERLPVPARAEPRKKLDAHAVTLARRGATDEHLGAIESELGTLADVGVRRTALTDLLTALDGAVQQAGTALPASLQPRLTDKVDAELRAAHAAADRGDLDALDRALAAGRRELAKVQGAALAERMPAAMPEPFTDDAAYQAVRTQGLGMMASLDASTDADEAVRLYEDALAVVARAWCAATAAYCRRAPAGAPADKVAMLERLAAEAAAARDRPPAEALAIIDRVLRNARGAMAGPAAMNVGAGDDEVPAHPSPLAAIPAIAAFITGGRPTARAARGALVLGDGIVLLGLIVIAVATGLRLLWAGSPLWGGWNDWLTALLWGGGLHAVGNDRFKGLLGLKKDLGKVE